jgi:hypothetical protein
MPAPGTPDAGIFHDALPFSRHCEERSDEAIQGGAYFWIASLLRASQWRLWLSKKKQGARGASCRVKGFITLCYPVSGDNSVAYQSE